MVQIDACTLMIPVAQCVNSTDPCDGCGLLEGWACQNKTLLREASMPVSSFLTLLVCAK